MKDPVWFKLLVRGIGILLVAQSVPPIFSAIGAATILFKEGWTNPGQNYWVSITAHGAGGLVQGVFGLYLLVGAPRLVRYCIRQVGTRCPGCDYDIRGLKGTCPECGLAIATPQSHPTSETSA